MQRKQDRGTGGRAHQTARHHKRRRIAAEAVAFLVLAMATAWSAAALKAAHVSGPELMAQPEQNRDEARPYSGESSPVFREIALNQPAAPEATNEPVADAGTQSVRWFDGRRVTPARTLWMRVTAYSPDPRSTAPFDDGLTSSLKSVWTNGMRLVAADPRVLPEGALVSVPGYHGAEVVPVLDRGGAIKGHRLDVLYPTHERALSWGSRWLSVTVWQYADGAE